MRIKPFNFLKSVRGKPLAPELRIGTVISAVPLRVLFDGEDLDPEGDAEIERPRAQHYLPRVGDRVVVRKMGRAWTVMGMVGLGLAGAQAPPGTVVVVAQRTVTQTIADATEVPINLTEGPTYAPWGGHSTTVNPSRITPPWAGLWRVEAHLGWDSNGVGVRMIRIQKNGSISIPSKVQAPSSGAMGLSTHAHRVMNGTTDYFEMIGFQSSGGSLATSNIANNYPEMRLYYSGPQY